MFETAELAAMMHTRALDLLRAVETSSTGPCLGDRHCRRQCFPAEASVALVLGLCLAKERLEATLDNGKEDLDRVPKAREDIQHGNRAKQPRTIPLCSLL